MSGRLAVAPLSDGRLQLWAVGPTTHTLFSMWQVSVIPTQPWTSLRLFNPNPSAVPDTTGVIYRITAGHSPDGRVQLWVPAFFQAPGSLATYGTMTTWKTTPDPDAAWLPWQPFVTPFITPGLADVGQLADGRMQLFALSGAEGPLGLRTSWKESSDPNANWSAWQLFNPQLSGGITDGAFIGSLSDGRLQAWAVGSQSGFSSSWQTSTDPSVAWTDWQLFSDSLPGTNDFLGAAVQLCNGLTQVWLVSSDGTLQTIQKTSTDASSGWTGWQPFLPSPGSIMDVTVGTLENGSCQIFVMAATAQGSVQILTSRQNRSGNPKNTPLHFWTDWTSIGTLS
jgi:hypothetical protein